MTDITPDLAATRARNALGRFAEGLKQGFAAYIERASRRRQIEALEAKSDAELAAMGLRRDRIAYHVFRDVLYV